MTRLPGRVPSASLIAQRATLERLVDTLTRIHALDGSLREIALPFAPFYELKRVESPPESTGPDLWGRAIEAVADEPRTPRRFIHRDFHPANTLWRGGELTGIVDWTGASFGPAAADLGHLLANLALTHGASVAVAARNEYVERAAAPPDERYWAIRMVLDFVPDLAPSDLSGGGLERLEDYLASLVDG
jgi:aminoglycoside phosphotransferase (APT) family kinase protein